MKKLFYCSLSSTDLYQLRADEIEQENVKKKSLSTWIKCQKLSHLLIKQLNIPAFTFNIDNIVDGMKAATAGKTAP